MKNINYKVELEVHTGIIKPEFQAAAVDAVT